MQYLRQKFSSYKSTGREVDKYDEQKLKLLIPEFTESYLWHRVNCSKINTPPVFFLFFFGRWKKHQNKQRRMIKEKLRNFTT